MNAALIGKTYAPYSHEVTRAEIEAYARATDESEPRYFGEAAMAPPLFVVTMTLPGALMQAVSDPALIPDPTVLLRVLHGEEEITWQRPLRAGERLETVGRIEGIEDKSSGRLIIVGGRLTASDGALVAETRSSLFIREPGKSRDKKPEPEHGSAAAWEMRWRVAADQSLRYAEAAGDRNPIHTDDNVARAVGLKGRVLQGLCTMAFAARCIVSQALAGDASRLHHMRVRFARPVYPLDDLCCRGYAQAASIPGAISGIGFSVVNQEGVTVLASGRADVSG